MRAILKEIRVARVIGKLEGLDLNSRDEEQAGSAGGKGQTNQVAALWIVDPRSLAEQMCGQSLYGSNAQAVKVIALCVSGAQMPPRPMDVVAREMQEVHACC